MYITIGAIIVPCSCFVPKDRVSHLGVLWAGYIDISIAHPQATEMASIWLVQCGLNSLLGGVVLQTRVGESRCALGFEAVNDWDCQCDSSGVKP